VAMELIDMHDCLDNSENRSKNNSNNVQPATRHGDEGPDFLFHAWLTGASKIAELILVLKVSNHVGTLSK